MITSPSDAAAPSRRRFRKRWLLYGIAILALFLLALRLFFMWSFDKPLPPNLAAVGDLPVTLADGRTGLLRDSIRPGVPTVISLWASWCGPCFLEAPKIAELRRRFPPEDLNIVYLNVRDSYAQPEVLAAHMERFSLPLDYAILADGDRLSELTNDPQSLIPRTFVFDRQGRPVATIVGYKPLALGRVAGLVSD